MMHILCALTITTHIWAGVQGFRLYRAMVPNWIPQLVLFYCTAYILLETHWLVTNPVDSTFITVAWSLLEILSAYLIGLMCRKCFRCQLLEACYGRGTDC